MKGGQGDRNWMLLFIDCDGDAGNHWPGYDFVANRGLVNGQSTTLKAYARGGAKWGPPVTILCRISGNELELAIPRRVVGVSSLLATIDFRWADNLEQAGDWSGLAFNGDTAPNDRFN